MHAAVTLPEASTSGLEALARLRARAETDTRRIGDSGARLLASHTAARHHAVESVTAMVTEVDSAACAAVQDCRRLAQHAEKVWDALAEAARVASEQLRACHAALHAAVASGDEAAADEAQAVAESLVGCVTARLPRLFPTLALPPPRALYVLHDVVALRAGVSSCASAVAPVYRCGFSPWGEDDINLLTIAVRHADNLPNDSPCADDVCVSVEGATVGPLCAVAPGMWRVGYGVSPDRAAPLAFAVSVCGVPVTPTPLIIQVRLPFVCVFVDCLLCKCFYARACLCRCISHCAHERFARARGCVRLCECVCL